LIKGTFKGIVGYVEVIIKGNNLLFFDVSTGQITTPEGLKFDKTGVIKEFPDLKDNDDWKKEAIKRLKTHMKKYTSEIEKLNYIKKELEKFGNEPLYYQRAGWRRTKKWN